MDLAMMRTILAVVALGVSPAGGPRLAAARARMDRAQAVALAAGARRIPRGGVGAYCSRQRLSEHGIFPPPIGGSTFTPYHLAARFGYDLARCAKKRALDE